MKPKPKVHVRTQAKTHRTVPREIAEELQQLRNVLFALVKEQGRLRFCEDTLKDLNETDSIHAEWVTRPDGKRDCCITFKRGLMVVPEGVRNGQTNRPNEVA